MVQKVGNHIPFWFNQLHIHLDFAGQSENFFPITCNWSTKAQQFFPENFVGFVEGNMEIVKLGCYVKGFNQEFSSKRVWDMWESLNYKHL
jgi:hypothetical protein